jgi:hypothetical protein
MPALTTTAPFLQELVCLATITIIGPNKNINNFRHIPLFPVQLGDDTLAGSMMVTDALWINKLCQRPQGNVTLNITMTKSHGESETDWPYQLH